MEGAGCGFEVCRRLLVVSCAVKMLSSRSTGPFTWGDLYMRLASMLTSLRSVSLLVVNLGLRFTAEHSAQAI